MPSATTSLTIILALAAGRHTNKTPSPDVKVGRQGARPAAQQPALSRATTIPSFRRRSAASSLQRHVDYVNKFTAFTAAARALDPRTTPASLRLSPLPASPRPVECVFTRRRDALGGFRELDSYARSINFFHSMIGSPSPLSPATDRFRRRASEDKKASTPATPQASSSDTPMHRHRARTQPRQRRASSPASPRSQRLHSSCWLERQRSRAQCQSMKTFSTQRKVPTHLAQPIGTARHEAAPRRLHCNK